jgi:hypothetical protein
MRASIAKDEEVTGDGSDFSSMKRSRAENAHPRAAFSNNNRLLLLVGLAGFRFRLRFWFRLARRWLFGVTR